VQNFLGKEVGQGGQGVDIVGHLRRGGRRPCSNQRLATAGRAAVARPATRRPRQAATGGRPLATGHSLSVQTGCDCGSCGLRIFFDFSCD
jgi:hypothetical protein